MIRLNLGKIYSTRLKNIFLKNMRFEGRGYASCYESERNLIKNMENNQDIEMLLNIMFNNIKI